KTTRAMSLCVSIMSWAAASGDGIEAARVPRMAARDAAQGEPRAAHRAVARDGVLGVVGAGGRETAGRAPPGTQEVPVGMEQRDEEALHPAGRAATWSKSERISASNARASAGIHLPRSVTTQSTPAAFTRWRRNASRTRRFT